MSLPRPPVLALVAIAFGLLVAAADNPWLGIDGGVALATSRLPAPEILDLWARADHPPLYYLLLHYWMAVAGTGAFVAKLPSLAAALLAVPLAYQTGRRLAPPALPSVRGELVEPRALDRPSTGSGRTRGGSVRGHGLVPFVLSPLAKGGIGGVALGLLTAYLVAISFSHVVRGVAVRDYALGVLLDFASLYAFLAALRPGAGRGRWPLYAVTSAAALYSFYFTLPLLLAQGLYLLLARDQRPRLLPWVAAMAGLALLYLPWVWLAAPHAWEKVSRSGAYVSGGVRPFPLDPSQGMLFLSLRWLTSSASLGVAPWVVGLALAGVGGLAWTQRRRARVQYLPLLVLGLLATLAFALAGTRLWQDDESVERFVYTALPFYAPLAGYGVLAAGKSHRLVMAALLVLVTVPFLRSLQIFLRPGSGEPQAELHVYLKEQASPRDLLLFTYPQQAGEFASVAREAWPWTVIPTSGFRFPVVERPDEQALALIRQQDVGRAIWLVLWDDDPRNLPVSATLATYAYPAGSAWAGTTYVAAYVPPQVATLQPLGVRFAGGIELVEAGYPARGSSSGALRVSLVWRADQPPRADYGVFVHLVDGTGRRWAQHDGPPAAGLRPASTWSVEEAVADRHGLLLPPDMPPGDYWLDVGLVGQGGRVMLEKGGNSVRLGPLAIH